MALYFKSLQLQGRLPPTDLIGPLQLSLWPGPVDLMACMCAHACVRCTH